uniref:Beta-defensin n=1 Tax=Oncorhynchus tshawytscha TaxID=74940 RepID=A0AAZ3NXU2_ONCTS
MDPGYGDNDTLISSVPEPGLSVGGRGDVNEAAAFPIPWGCSNYSGVCRAVCLSAELPFGPFGCAKGFVCCVAHVF